MVNFVDLLPEFSAMAGNNEGSSPHRIACDFVLEKGRQRGNVEIVVVIDKRGSFVAAGTEDRTGNVALPLAITSILHDPSAKLVIHHNHPPREEPCFSVVDMGAVATNRGIDWLFVHTENGYSAMRVSDRLFKPDASGALPAAGLVSAYKAATSAAQNALDQETNLSPDAMEAVAPELALQALQRSGAIRHYSSISTGLSHEQERAIVDRIGVECAANARKAGGIALWQEPSHASLHAASGRRPGRPDRDHHVFPASTLEVGFELCVAIISGPNAAAIDGGTSGRPESPQLPQAGGNRAGMEGGSSPGKPVLEAGPRVRLKPRF